MAATIRSVDFLPEIFQTSANKQFLSATLDQLIQEPQYKHTQGFIGRKVGPGVNFTDGYVILSFTNVIGLLLSLKKLYIFYFEKKEVISHYNDIV